MKPGVREIAALDAEVRNGRQRALSRAYPLLKQAAEILELEAIEPLATPTKRLRQEVGALLDDSNEFGA